MNEYIASLVIHRERFQSWGLVISFLSLITAIWTRAPELEVEIPLLMGAKATINVGYVVSLAPTLIAFSLFWVLGALISMRRYQVALMKSGKNFEPCELVSILGPLCDDHDNQSTNKDKVLYYLYKPARKIRVFYFFVLPIISQLVIINTMFMDLAFYHKEKFLNNITFQTTDRIIEASKFNPRDVKDLGYWTFFSKVTTEKGADYTLSFNELNKNCGMYFYLEYLDKRISNLSKEEIKDRDNLKK
ncbi:hypothetical protein [Vibrio sp.]|uniref:hypothetical protein n=1 Tax=Vibrio sp. TaxID=678 RepID=UPI003AA7E676